MQLRLSFLRSKVARRIFLLFITCSLLPIVALSIVSSRFVIDQLNDRNREQLHGTAKSMGMEILGRLSIAENELTLVATLLDAEEDPAAAARWNTIAEARSGRFRNLAILDGGGRPLRVTGDLEDPPIFDESARRRLDAGEIHLTVSTASGRPRVFLGRALGDAGTRLALVGEVDPEFLSGVQDGVGFPPNTELLLLDSTQHVLFRSPGVTAAHEQTLREVGSIASEFTWSDEEREYIGRSWSLFLAGRYGAPSWTVVLSVSRADVLAPLAQFAKLLPLVAALCLAVVTLLSFVQIRKSLVPLEILRRGTLQISRGSFDARIAIDSRDEFRQLADSFNSMASRLGRQFQTLSTVAEIDRTILSTVKVAEIARAVVLRIPDRFPCDCVAVTIVRRRERNSARLYVQHTDGAADETVETVWLDSDERDRLAAAGGESLLLTRREFPAHLGLLADRGIECCLLLPVMVREALAGCIGLGYGTTPHLKKDDLTEARELADRVAVALSNARLIEELEQANWETLHALARAVDANSPWTAGHSERVTALALKLGRRLGLPEEELLILHRGGLLHDVGKIGVPAEVLDKPGSLTAEEMELMRSHVTIGARILEPISAYADEIPIVLYHHEQYDGSGYPEGLVGEQIPFHARIMGVADVFDALISERPYRKSWSLERVVSYIERGAGTLYDPRVVEAFLETLEYAKRKQKAEGVEACAVLQSA